MADSKSTSVREFMDGIWFWLVHRDMGRPPIGLMIVISVVAVVAGVWIIVKISSENKEIQAEVLRNFEQISAAQEKFRTQSESNTYAAGMQDLEPFLNHPLDTADNNYIYTTMLADGEKNGFMLIAVPGPESSFWAQYAYKQTRDGTLYFTSDLKELRKVLPVNSASDMGEGIEWEKGNTGRSN